MKSLQQKTLPKPEVLENEDDWFTFRLGRITASEIWKLMKSGKVNGNLFSQTGMTYLMQKVGEIICGQNEKIDNVKAMEWGKRWEPYCAEALREKGFVFDYYGGDKYIFFPFNNFSGSSIDGISDTHIIEMKCPYTKEAHVENLLFSAQPDPIDCLERNRFEYLMQMYFEMICTGREKGYFVSYDPRPVDPRYKICIIEVPADENRFNEMKLRVRAGGEIIKKCLKDLNKIKGL